MSVTIFWLLWGASTAAYVAVLAFAITRFRRDVKALKKELAAARAAKLGAEINAAAASYAATEALTQAKFWHELMTFWRRAVVKILHEVDPAAAETLRKNIARLDADHAMQLAFRRSVVEAMKQ